MFYYNLSSIQDQAQLSSSNRLEMAAIAKWLPKINHPEITNFWGFFEFVFLPKEYIWLSVGVMKPVQTKTVAILLIKNQLCIVPNPLLASQ